MVYWLDMYIARWLLKEIHDIVHICSMYKCLAKLFMRCILRGVHKSDLCVHVVVPDRK